jgi:hypothetical protein
MNICLVAALGIVAFYPVSHSTNAEALSDTNFYPHFLDDKAWLQKLLSISVSTAASVSSQLRPVTPVLD